MIELDEVGVNEKLLRSNEMDLQEGVKDDSRSSYGGEQ